MKIEDAKVLVVDDDKIMMMYVTRMLSRLGVAEVSEATDGNTGLALVASFRPDIVLTDVHMAPMDGLEFVRRLRAHTDTELRKTPVLLMSADSSAGKSNASMLMGIAGYVVKPPELSALQVNLSHALKFRVAPPEKTSL